MADHKNTESGAFEELSSFRSKSAVHIPVLLKEVVGGLGPKSGEILVDCTFGLGGHSKALCLAVPNLHIIGIDLNADTLESSASALRETGCQITAVEDNFRNLDKILDVVDIKAASKYLFDLGWSSVELEESKRGFSFLRDEPLLMTYKANPTQKDLTAEEIVNTWQEENLETIIAGFGEERFSKKIAKGIVEARKKKKIASTFDLVDVIKNSVPLWYRHGKLHFATKTFQALRIATNDELESLKSALKVAFHRLVPGGRIAVITFHSLEDRIVKNYFKELKDSGEALLINKKPLKASAEEIASNPRSRSAKLRIIEKK